jgi:hypothetical protein
MKTNHYLFLASTLILLLNSCTIQKRLHRPGYHISFNKKPASLNELITSEIKTSNHNSEIILQVRKSESLENSNLNLATTSFSQLDSRVPPSKTESTTTRSKQVQCDQMVLKNGDDRAIIVREITPNDIKYHKCDNQNGVIYSIPISEVLFIKYANGTKESFDKPTNIKTEKPTEANLPIHPLAIVGFMFAFLFPFLGSILCLIAVKQIEKNPNKYRGKGLAVAGSVIALILAIILLAVLLV